MRPPPGGPADIAKLRTRLPTLFTALAKVIAAWYALLILQSLSLTAPQRQV